MGCNLAWPVQGLFHPLSDPSPEAGAREVLGGCAASAKSRGQSSGRQLAADTRRRADERAPRRCQGTLAPAPIFPASRRGALLLRAFDRRTGGRSGRRATLASLAGAHSAPRPGAVTRSIAPRYTCGNSPRGRPAVGCRRSAVGFIARGRCGCAGATPRPALASHRRRGAHPPNARFAGAARLACALCRGVRGGQLCRARRLQSHGGPHA